MNVRLDLRLKRIDHPPNCTRVIVSCLSYEEPKARRRALAAATATALSPVPAAADHRRGGRRPLLPPWAAAEAPIEAALRHCV